MTHKALQAGALYFLIVFAIGFALGTIRVLLLIPAIGDLAAVLIELPILLTLAWIICARLMARAHIPHRLGPRLIVGASALLLLLSAEFSMSVWLFGSSPAAYLEAMRTPAGTVGLVGQLVYAAFPVVQLKTAGV